MAPRLFIALLLALALALSGCGGDDEGPTTTAPAGATERSDAAPQAQEPEQGGDRQGGAKRQEGSGGESPNATPAEPTGPPPTTSASLPNEGTKRPAPSVPTNKGGDNSIQTYGVESGSADRAEAALALQAYLDARAAGDWASACSYLTFSTRLLLEKFAERVPRLRGAGCAEVMAAFAQGVPPAALAAEARIEVISLRVEGDRAFVIYRSPGNRVSTTPMAKENGAWKVAGMGATPLG
jgi:hypothetical protein